MLFCDEIELYKILYKTCWYQMKFLMHVNFAVIRYQHRKAHYFNLHIISLFLKFWYIHEYTCEDINDYMYHILKFEKGAAWNEFLYPGILKYFIKSWFRQTGELFLTVEMNFQVNLKFYWNFMGNITKCVKIRKTRNII